MKLKYELAVVGVNPPADFTPEGYTVIVFDRGEVGDMGTLSGDRAKGGNNGANPAPGEALLPIESNVASRTVVIVKPTTDTRAKDAVLDGEIPKFERLEDGIFYTSLSIGPKTRSVKAFLKRPSGSWRRRKARKESNASPWTRARSWCDHVSHHLPRCGRALISRM